jgi:hypothetical protein
VSPGHPRASWFGDAAVRVGDDVDGGLNLASFGSGQGQESPDPVQKIIELATLRFGVHNRTMSVRPGTAGADTVLVDQSGYQFEMRTMVTLALAVPPGSDKFYSTIIGQVDAAVAIADAPPIPSLSDDELEQQVRIRLAPESIRQTMNVAYARPVTTGLVAVLCADNSLEIRYLTEDLLAGRDTAALYNAAFRTVMAEPLVSNEEHSPGIRMLVGDSVFAASKAIGMGSLIGAELPPAPFGVVFGVPYGNVIFAHVVTGRESIPVIGRLANLVNAEASDDAPGGWVSPLTYFWRGTNIEPIGFPGTDGRVHVMASGKFGEMLEVFPQD